MKSHFQPTLELLTSSVVVALSGGFRLHIAFLLAGIAARIPVYCAVILIIYATYTLDRTLDCKEDAINRHELCGANRKLGLLVCIVSFLLGLYILISEGIFLTPFFPFIIGYFYTHGIRVGPFRLKLKGGTGVKNIVIGLTWGGTITLIVSRWCMDPAVLAVIFLFFGFKTFVTSCVNDFKDIKGDIAAGIRTLPVCLGEGPTKLFLAMILLGVHSIVFYSVSIGILRNEWILLLCGLIIFLGFLLVYSPAFETSPSLVRRKMREVAISWESAISLALRAYVVQ